MKNPSIFWDVESQGQMQDLLGGGWDWIFADFRWLLQWKWGLAPRFKKQSWAKPIFSIDLCAYALCFGLGGGGSEPPPVIATESCAVPMARATQESRGMPSPKINKVSKKVDALEIRRAFQINICHWLTFLVGPSLPLVPLVKLK